MNGFSDHAKVDGIYWDFSIAFDQAIHKVLLSILMHSGIGEPLLTWFGLYLSNRKNIVKVYIEYDLVPLTFLLANTERGPPLCLAFFILKNTQELIHQKYNLYRLWAASDF